MIKCSTTACWQNPLGQQEIVVGGSNAPLMGFSSLNDLVCSPSLDKS